MSDEVANLVLRNIYLQTQAITMMERLSGPRLGSKQHFISVLEEEGLLNRDLEFLPEDEELTDRRNRGDGLTRPELSVLLSYSKIRLYQQLLASNVPEDPYLSAELISYFPQALQERYTSHMHSHRLRREIIATQVTNSLINRMGASFTLRMHEDTGAQAGEIARAYTIAREVFAAREFWRQVERLDNRVPSELQIAALLQMWELLRQATRWLLNLPSRDLDIGRMVKRLTPGLRSMKNSIRGKLGEAEEAALRQRMEPYLQGGFSRKLAEQTAMLEALFPALDVVETAARRRTAVDRVARVSFGLADAFELEWLRRQIESLEVSGQWHAMSRSNLRDELIAHQNRLVERVLIEHGRKKTRWLRGYRSMAKRQPKSVQCWHG